MRLLICPLSMAKMILFRHRANFCIGMPSGIGTQPIRNIHTKLSEATLCLWDFQVLSKSGRSTRFRFWTRRISIMG